MILDFKLNFQENLENMLNKVNKTIGLLRKLQNTLPRPSLLTIYKSFIRPHLDYGNVMYDQAYNVSFQQKVESIQYNAAVAITGAIRGTYKEKLFEELGLESLQHSRWYRKLCCFYKILKDQSPKYLFNIIPKLNRPYPTRNANNIPHFKVKHSFFKNTFFLSVTIEWNKLDPEMQNAPSLNIFKKNILKFIRPTANKIFGCHNLKGIKYLTRLRLGLSHLHEHKFKNNFRDKLNPFCTCGCDVENTCHFLLHCPNFLTERNTLFNKITNIDSNILNQADATITKTLLFGNSKYSSEINLQILNVSIDFILTSKRFDEPLLNS